MTKTLSSFSDTQLITLQDQNYFDKQKIAGQCVAQCLYHCKKLIEAQTLDLTLKKLESDCFLIMKEMNCTPTFFGYKGFPGLICTSVNSEVVHGIPSNYLLQSGDVVKVDLGATYQGAIADAAITAIYGSAKSPTHLELIKTCQEALMNGIKAIQIGQRLGRIGNAIHHTVKNTRFGLIVDYGGHGISDVPHTTPFVPNRSQPTDGIRIQPGLTIAIEPMLVIGDNRTSVAKDNWTVIASGISAHFEHTVFITSEKIHIMTQLDNNEN